jgi:hypothetical protein
MLRFFQEELRRLDGMIVILERTREAILATLKVSRVQQMSVVGMQWAWCSHLKGKAFDQPDNARRSGKLEIKEKTAKVVTPRGPSEWRRERGGKESGRIEQNWALDREGGGEEML